MIINNHEIVDIEYDSHNRFDVMELYQTSPQDYKHNITVSRNGAAELIKVLQEWLNETKEGNTP